MVVFWLEGSDVNGDLLKAISTELGMPNNIYAVSRHP